MIREGYKEVKISIKELVDLSGGTINKGNIERYCERAKSSGSNSWRSEPDPTDGRKILIYYSTIPDQTIKKYNLPTVAGLIDHIKLEAALVRADQKQLELDLRDNLLKKQINEAVTNEFVKYCPQYDKQYPGKREKVLLFAKTHAVLICCMELKPGYTIPELHRAYLNTPGINHKLKNQIRFGQKLKEFEDNDNQINLVHKSRGGKKDYLVKLTPWHIGKVEQYYSDPKKYPVRLIHELLLEDCRAYNKGTVQFATVAKYLGQKEVKNRLSVFRDKAYYRRVVQPTTRRVDALFTGDLYYCDGSPVQIPYYDAELKKLHRLNLFVVMDVKSKKIVGFDLARSEDVNNWLSAFKMAFTTELLLPYEIMYDNASATKTAEFNALKQAALVKGCQFNPAGKGAPTHKADVERWFETFQSGYQRMIDGFIGEGIRSKRDNGRIDIEYLAKVHKEKGHYSFAEMVELVTKLIAIYNSEPTGKGITPNDAFKEGERPNAASVTAADLALLFWTFKEVKISNSEIVLEVRKKGKHFFEVYDHATAFKLDGGKFRVYYDENDLSEAHVFSLSGEYICHCRQKVQIKKAKANQTEADVLQIIKQSSHNRAKERAAKTITSDIAAIAMADNEDTFLQTANPFDVAYKNAINEAETQVLTNYVQHEKGLMFTGNYQAIENTATLQPVKRKLTIQERHAKKNIVPATLQPVKRP